MEELGMNVDRDDSGLIDGRKSKKKKKSCHSYSLDQLVSLEVFRAIKRCPVPCRS